MLQYKIKIKATRQWKPTGLLDVEDPTFSRQSALVVRLLALRAGSSLPPGTSSTTHFCQRLSKSQGHGEAGKIR
jgi:ABC-type tungstate transport system permease subunit